MRRCNVFAKIFSTLFTLGLLSGCNLPAPKDKHGNGSATFTVMPMADGSKALDTAIQNEFSLPSAKTFNLRVCLKDVAYSRPITDHEFLIEESQQKVTSDTSGCMTWAEKIDFNFLADSQYIRIERHIIGQGLHRGSQTVAFAINPWASRDSLPSVLNPDDGKIEKLINDKEQGSIALKGYTENNKVVERPLWVEEARLSIAEQKMTSNGVMLAVDVRANPTVKLAKMNGEPLLYPLTTGKFKGRIKLIHVYQENNKDLHRILGETDLLDEAMENSSLAMKYELLLPVLPTRGQVMLALELQPTNGPQGLKNFEGIYLLGDFDQIKGSNSVKINTAVSQSKNFKIADYVNSSTADILPRLQNESLNAEEPYHKPKIEVTELEATGYHIGAEKTSAREIVYSVKACIHNNVDSKNIKSQIFKVTKFRQSENEPDKTEQIKSDDKACLNWEERFTYNYYECQHYIKGFIQIENSDLGMNDKFEILLNPWPQGKVDFHDMRYLDQTQKRPLNCQSENRPQTQVLLDTGFLYGTNSYGYSIDEFLNLNYTKKIQIKMAPHILMYSSVTNGREEVRNLRDGIYLLRTAIIQNPDYDENSTYVTSADSLVNVTNGSINTELIFQTQDLKALGNRNNILIEIYPVDESKIDYSTTTNGVIRLKNQNEGLESAIDFNSGLNSPTFIGPIKLGNDEGNVPLRPLNASEISHTFLTGQSSNLETGSSLIQKVVNQGKKDFAEKRKKIQERANLQSYAKNNNLDLISLRNSEEKSPLTSSLIHDSKVDNLNTLTKSELFDIVNSGKLTPRTAHKLCAFWAGDYLRKLYANKGGALKPTTAYNFGSSCMQAIAKDPTSFFTLAKHLHVNEVGGSQYLKGYSQSLSVGASFSMSKSHSFSESRGHTLGMKASFGQDFEFFEIGAGYGYSLSWTTTDSDSASNSVSVANSTSLTLQQNIFKIRINNYDSCATVRLNPELFIKDHNWKSFFRRDYREDLNTNLTPEEQSIAMNRGLLLCTGENKKEPKDIIENYYLISQDSSTLQMQDNGDARNRNFFITLRSKSDFNRFVLAIKGNANTPSSANKEDNSEEELKKTMEQLFLQPSPTSPGMYLLQ
ncbi:MAG: hypothetical protein ACXVCY_03550 [Pseudobdellovibrionaceae bacterium]